ncbi:hypothetical protein KP509_15G047600 [Ceratopteris richardii]|uniref:Uncharacterized protein n=1 Tax=Ceratopteris richardii TaxID=49495 RepID=A0A8T2T966_CERRI|nr:hypothetical protein KP509_15G047600 [Ceratopteris richardii]
MLRTLHYQSPSSAGAGLLPTFGGCSNRNSSCSGRIHRLLLRPSFFSSANEVMEVLTRAPSSSSSGRLISFYGSPCDVRASLTEYPVLWAVRTCIFYALLQTGVVRQQQSGSVQDGSDTLDWLKKMFGEDKAMHLKEIMRGRNKWQTTTKGTLKRRFRVPSKAEGRRLLNQISSLLSDDDTFRDATSHKGCQIRRENAHAETVCCHNVRAMFDELPTPHLVIEITAFPAGPITPADYEKADKLEKLLRRGNSI